MFKSIALFALLNAALVSSVALVPKSTAATAVAEGTDSANAITVVETCTQTNLRSCLVFTSTTLPVGCTSLDSAGQSNDVESVSTASGIQCTFFTGTVCTGSSQLINGTLNDLSVVGFSNVANSFTCQSN